MATLLQRSEGPSAAIARIELTTEMLQRDIEELSLKLEAHMRSEALNRQDIIDKISSLKLYLAVIVALTGADAIFPILRSLL